MFLKHNTAYFCFSIGAALSLHVLVFSWLISNYEPRVIPANIYSPSSQVSVRFVTMETQVNAEVSVDENIHVQEVQPKQIKKKQFQNKQTKSVKRVKTPTLQKAKVQKKLSSKKIFAPPVLNATNTSEKKQHKQQNAPIPVISDASVKGYRTPPHYPIKAKRRKQQGVVIIHVLISKTGKREDIKIHAPSKYAMLNRAALKAVKKWRFEPYIINGKPVRSWVEIPIEFKIK